MTRLFKDNVLRVYHTARQENKSTDSKGIWVSMKKVVFIDNHVVAIRDRIYQLKYDRKSESIIQYRQVALAKGGRVFAADEPVPPKSGEIRKPAPGNAC